MSPVDPTINAPFREYADLQLRRHLLLLEGKAGDQETAALEDRMDALWQIFDEVQQRSLNGMASDLNWIRRNGQQPPKGFQGPEQVTAQAQEQLKAAIAAKQWHGILHSLRSCAPLFPGATLAHLRAHAYKAIGLSNYAGIFFERAADLDPANADLGVAALDFLEKTNPQHAARRAEAILASPFHFPPVVLALAAMAILERNKTGQRATDAQEFSGLLNDIVKRLRLEPSSPARALGYQAVASAFESLGDVAAALRCLEEGLQSSPQNEVLLVGKALLVYQSRPDQAVEMFRRLAQGGSASIWPYFLLAHSHLRSRNYSAALEMAGEAWTRASSDRERATLLQWQAICLAELRYPAEVVRPAFEKAVSLDPSNSLIAENYAVLEEVLGAVKKSEWHIEEPSALKLPRGGTLRELELVRIP